MPDLLEEETEKNENKSADEDQKTEEEDTENVVEVQISGFGYEREKENNIRTLDRKYIESTLYFTDPIEFGKFIGDRYYNKIPMDVYVPDKFSKTWNIDGIVADNTDIIIGWAEKFSSSSINKKNLTTFEVLSHWLKYTGDETVRKSIVEYESF